MTSAIEQAVEALREASEALTACGFIGSTYSHIDAALARLTAERAAVPPDRELWIFQQADRITDGFSLHDDVRSAIMGALDRAAALRSPADGWRAGAAAMREACAVKAEAFTALSSDGFSSYDIEASYPIKNSIAAAIRTLPLPSPPAEEKTP